MKPQIEIKLSRSGKYSRRCGLKALLRCLTLLVRDHGQNRMFRIETGGKYSI